MTIFIHFVNHSLRLWLQINVSTLFSFVQTDRRGHSTTFFGKVRRVRSPFGWSVVTCPKFKCKKGDMVFVLRGMRTTTPNEKKKWIGYTFDFGDNDDRRPPHPFSANILHAPMMVNTHCAEKDETFNLALNTEGDIVVFEAVREILGGETLLVDYGPDYNKELFDEREQQRCSRKNELASRKNRNHTFQCSNCGHTCQQRYRLSHYNSCKVVCSVEKTWVQQNIQCFLKANANKVLRHYGFGIRPQNLYRLPIKRST